MKMPRRPLAAFAFLVSAIACGGSSDGPTDVGGGGTPTRRLVVITGSPEFLGTGDSAVVSAELRDEAGRPVVGTIGWSVSDALVAEVDAGRVRALRPGTARIVATSAGAEPDTAMLTVTARITHTQAGVDSVLITSREGEAQVTASSRGGLATLPGSYTWSIADTTIAVVTQAGVVTPRRNGRTELVVREAGGSADTVPVRIAARLQVVAQVVTSPFSRAFDDQYLVLPFAEADTVRVTATSSAPDVVAAPSIVIPPGQRFGPLVFDALSVGTATVRYEVPGYAVESTTVASRALRATVARQSFTPNTFAYATRAMLQIVQMRVDGTTTAINTPRRSVLLRLESTAPGIVGLPTDSTGIVITGGNVSGYDGWAEARGAGTAWVRWTGTNVVTDSLQLTVQPLALALTLPPGSSPVVGVGQRLPVTVASVGTVGPLSFDVPVAVVARDARVTVPAGVQLAAELPTTPFEVVGATPGTDTLVASGSHLTTAKLAVTVATPILYASVDAGPTVGTTREFGMSVGAPGVVRRPAQVVRVAVTSSDPAILEILSGQVEIRPDGTSTLYSYRAVAPGTATLRFTEESGLYPALEIAVTVRP